MKLTVLVDNNTFIDRYYLGEPGVCYYIEDGDSKLLFDVGYSDIFIKNAETMGIDLSAVSSIVISHGHNDHTRGLKYLFEQFNLSKVRIIAHPDALKDKLFDGSSIGSPFSAELLQDRCVLSLTKTPQKISENITFLGEIPEFNHFEARESFGLVSDGQCEHEDFVLDDSALVYDSGNGLFIITGCSHSGICNIVEYAKQVCRNNHILGIIGGFHLFDLSSRLTKTINYFKEHQITQLYPCHCVSFVAKAEINNSIPINEVGVGLSIEIN